MNYSFCICGGGALGHIMISVLSSKGYDVNLLTNHPEKWENEIITTDLHGKVYNGRIKKISSDPKNVIPESDIVLLCLPGFLISSVISKIKPYLKKDYLLGCIVASTGFFITSISELGDKARLFAFQRVPYIARVEEYGKKSLLLGYKRSLNMAFYGIDNSEYLKNMFFSILETEIMSLKNMFEATLTNSNPLLHPTRLYNIFKDFKEGVIYPDEIYFYEDWNDESSELLIACDNEFQKLLLSLPVSKNCIPSLLDYYESFDKSSLTQKISSIEAFKKIKAPMNKVDGGYVPDFSSRYFIEDIPYGLLLIKYISQIQEIQTPNIDKVIYWCQKVMAKSYIKDGKLICDSPDVKIISCLNDKVIKRLILNHGQ